MPLPPGSDKLYRIRWQSASRDWDTLPKEEVDPPHRQTHISPPKSRKHQNTLLIKYHMVRQSSQVWRASLLTVYSRAELRDDVLHSLGKGVQRRDSRNLLVGLWAS